MIPDDERTTRITAKRAARKGLPLCVQCHRAWVSKAHRLTCSPTCRRLYRIRQMRELLEPEHKAVTLIFPKEPLL